MSAEGKQLTRAAAGSVTERSRSAWDERQVAVIASTVAIGATLPQLHMFLEVAAKYELDPLTREIWCAVPKKNGVYDTERVLIMVGRDGFLKIAQRSGELLGMQSDVVREGDKFTSEFSTERTTTSDRKVRHSYGTKRGPIIGAWCIVHRQGRKPTYFYAPWEDYAPDGDYRSPWKKQKSAMILKVAEVNALRRAFSITGVYIEEEMAALTPGEVAAGSIEPAAAPTAEPARLAALDGLFDTARLYDEQAYSPAKQRLMLAGADDEKVSAITAELEGFIRRHGGGIEDAEVVGDGPTNVAESADAPTETAVPLASDPSAVESETKDEADSVTNPTEQDPWRAARERHGIAPGDQPHDEEPDFESGEGEGAVEDSMEDLGGGDQLPLDGGS